ncbi:MAG: cytidylate kinase-like family protein [Clostridia bacterium]|nr:cytidylate kinase-like family protein [Clostridia bacterium]
MMNTVITISRQFGSGGRLIGKLLAERLGIPFYDKEIIEHASQNSGLAEEFIKENEQKRKGISSYAIYATAWGGKAWNNFDNLEAQIYAAEAQAINDFAKHGACVIVGRCADYVLKKRDNCLNVFIHADMDSRVKRVMEVYGDADSVKKAEKLIRDTDKLRARHYRYYTDTEWGNSDNYHLCVNSAAFGVDRCVEMLISAYQEFDKR